VIRVVVEAVVEEEEAAVEGDRVVVRAVEP
jgi:hypothetical protein